MEIEYFDEQVQFKCEFRKNAMSLADIPVEIITRVCKGDIVSRPKDGKVTVDVFEGFDLLTGRLVTLPVDKLYTIFDTLANNEMESVGILDVEKLKRTVDL